MAGARGCRAAVAAIDAIIAGDMPVLAFTSQIQIRHLLDVAGPRREALLDALNTHVLVGAVGPTCAAACTPPASRGRRTPAPEARAAASAIATARAGAGITKRPIMNDQRHGHLPTLFACFLHFDLSFMLWVLVGALGILIAEDLQLSAGQRGVFVALPILSGSLLRIPLGLFSDQWGARRVGGTMLGFLFVPVTIGWLAAIPGPRWSPSA